MHASSKSVLDKYVKFCALCHAQTVLKKLPSCNVPCCSALIARYAIDNAKEIYDKVPRQVLLKDHNVLGGALMNMYTKCGGLCQAQVVLENLSS